MAPIAHAALPPASQVLGFGQEFSGYKNRNSGFEADMKEKPSMPSLPSGLKNADGSSFSAPSLDGIAMPSMPNVEMPKLDGLSMPKFDAPNVEMPKLDGLSMPKLDGVSMPKLDGLSLPKLDGLSVPAMPKVDG